MSTSCVAGWRWLDAAGWLQASTLYICSCSRVVAYLYVTWIAVGHEHTVLLRHWW